MAVVEIHTSDRVTFKRCRRKWDLASRMRKGLEPIRVNDKLWLGNAVHFSLSEYYLNKHTLLDAFKIWTDNQIKKITTENNGLWMEQQQLINGAVELGYGMLSNYSLWAPANDPLYFVEVIATERDFEIPIFNPSGNRVRALYKGRFDGIVRDQYGLYWLLEHKTAAQFDTAKLPLDEQCGSYILAAQHMFGIKLEGVLYTMLRKKIPAIPEPLKNGGLTKRANIDTTLDVYVDALIKYYGSKEAVPWQDYADILQTLKDKGNTFVVRERVRRSQTEIKNLQNQIYQEYKDMTDPKIHIYPNPTRDCAWDCDFRPVCLAMNDGSDYKYLLETSYQPRKEVSLYEGIEE